MGSLGLLHQFLRWGQVEWIGLRPARRAHPSSCPEAIAVAGAGLVGDHYNGGSGSRGVTLIQSEHLAVVAALMGLDDLAPALLRRNLVISGLNLLALKGQCFQVGEAVLEGTGPCHPCSRMEEALGPGGLNAMRGHGGLTARILQGGLIRIGDPVLVLAEGTRP
jgi:MOSC domain-containing protein YiiM